jgi:hypothetical protein
MESVAHVTGQADMAHTGAEERPDANGPAVESRMAELARAVRDLCDYLLLSLLLELSG